VLQRVFFCAKLRLVTKSENDLPLAQRVLKIFFKKVVKKVGEEGAVNHI
jgi:hypothetical protein